MSMLNEILEHNRNFVRSGEYVQFMTDKFPDKKIAILTCMDARIMELLPKAMGLRNGDAKFIKNAGAFIAHPFGSVMRNLLIAVYQLGVQEIMVIAHTDCGMRGMDPEKLLNQARAAGVSDEAIQMLGNAGIDQPKWLKGFDNITESVQHSVNIIKKHPLMPTDIPVHGLVVHSTTGSLTLLIDGNQI